MRRVGNLIDEIISLDNLLLAFHKAQIGKKAQSEVVAFRSNLHENLKSLSDNILSGRVEVGNYRRFVISDPKKREICAAAFGERVLHHALMNVCHPVFERNLIYDTYATRKGKGVYEALEKAHKAMTCYPFVAKLDIRKYFASISHEILKKQLRRLFKDKTLLVIFDSVIDSYETSQGCGLPIGNLTSQYFANFYLSSFDHYIKEVLRAPVYVRYMDDIMVFAETKNLLEGFVAVMSDYITSRLQVEFKPPVVVTTLHPVSFLGYRLQGHRIGLNSRSRRRFARKLRIYERLLNDGTWTGKDYYEHVSPLVSFTEWAYAKRSRAEIIKTISVGG